MVLLLVYLCLNYGSYGTAIYMLQFYSDQGKEYLSSLCYAGETIGNCCGILAVMVVMERVDRRLLLFIGFVGDGILTLVFHLFEIDAAILTVIFLKGVFSETIWAVIYVYLPECYPSSLRGTATGCIMAPSRIGSIVAALSGATVYAKSAHMLFITNGIVLLVAAFCVLFLPFETRGRQLQV